MLFISAALQVALALSSVAAQRLDKPAAWPNLDEFGPELNKLPAASVKVSRWTSNTMPKGCMLRARRSAMDPGLFQPYTITFGDCEMPWIVCQEKDALPKIEKIADTLARLPVGMRQYVGDIVHFKDGGGGSAWHQGEQCILKMNGQSPGTVGIWFHESSHCVDRAGGIGLSNGDERWQDAYNRDSHVPDEYARSSHGENFAQFAGLVVYDRVTNRKLRQKTEWGYIRRQFERWGSSADGPGMLDTGATKKCTKRYPHSDTVTPIGTDGSLQVSTFDPKKYPRIEFMGPAAQTRKRSEEVETNCTFSS